VPQARGPVPHLAVDEQDCERADDRPYDLADEVAWHVRPGEAPGGGEANRDGRVIVPAGDLSRDDDAAKSANPSPRATSNTPTAGVMRKRSAAAVAVPEPTNTRINAPSASAVLRRMIDCVGMMLCPLSL
jgi:hypothetical protein